MKHFPQKSLNTRRFTRQNRPFMRSIRILFNYNPQLKLHQIEEVLGEHLDVKMALFVRHSFFLLQLVYLFYPSIRFPSLFPFFFFLEKIFSVSRNRLHGNWILLHALQQTTFLTHDSWRVYNFRLPPAIKCHKSREHADNGVSSKKKNIT